MPENDPHQLGDRLLRPLIWSILIALAIYGGSVVLSDMGEVRASAARLDVGGWLVVLGLSLANYGLRFARWELYLHRLGNHVQTHLSLAYYLGGLAFTTTPGKAGEAVRSLYLKRHGVTYVHSLAAFFTERLLDLVAMVLLALLAASAFPAYRWPMTIVALLIVAVLPLIHSRRLHAYLDRHLERLPTRRLRTVGFHVLHLVQSASSLLRSGPLYAGLALALIAWGAEALAFHVILQTLGVGTSLLLAVGIYSTSVLVGAVSFLPGGLGSTEAIMILMLSSVGADMPTAVAATLICRLATLWFAVAIGAIVITALELSSRTDRPRVQAHRDSGQ